MPDCSHVWVAKAPLCKEQREEGKESGATTKKHACKDSSLSTLWPMNHIGSDAAQRKSSVSAVPGCGGVAKVRVVWAGMADTLLLN